jgi:hypothetical protein
LIYEMKVRGNPSAILRNQTGNSTWLLGDIQWLGTGSQPALTTVTSGTPTFSQIAPMTNAGGGSSTSTATHNVSVTPTVTAGPGIGASPSGISLNQTQITSTDLSGQVAYGTDPTAVGAAGSVLFTVTFGTPFTSAPKVRLSPGNPVTAGRGLMYTEIDSSAVDVTTTGFSVRCAQAMAVNGAATVYRVNYQVDGV